jgi:ferrous iron transport protein A
MNLNDAELEKEYVISSIDTDDEEMKDFLFTLGCYGGEKITVIDKKRNLVISVKDARYNIDRELAQTIII